MPLVKIPARNWKFYVENGTANTFQRIGGLESFKVSNDNETMDTSDFDDDGWEQHMVVGRSAEMELEGGFKIDPTDGKRDAGQDLVEQMAAAIGVASMKKFRVKDPAGKVTEYVASAKMGDVGGGLKDKTSWSATIKISGKPLKITGTDTGIYKDTDV